MTSIDIAVVNVRTRELMYRSKIFRSQRLGIIKTGRTKGERLFT